MTRKTNPPASGRRANNVPEVGWTGSSSYLDSEFAQRRTAHHPGIRTKSQVRHQPFGPEIVDLMHSGERDPKTSGMGPLSTNVRLNFSAS